MGTTRFVAAGALVLLLAVPGAVMADEHEPVDDRLDTTFNLAYDAEHQVLLWNLSLSDGPHDCSLNQAGSLRASYGVSLDGVVPINDLRLLSGDPVTFPENENAESPSDPVEDPGPDSECSLSGATVSGPRGQVNHGSFMSLFNSIWEGPGRGCVARFLARTDFGQGDQQVRVGDDDGPAAATLEVSDGAVGTVDFLTFAADCERGNRRGEGQSGNGIGQGQGNGHGQGNGQGQGNGHGGGNGRPDSPGNSGNAPGHNK